MSDETPKPERTLGAREIARIFGRKKRAVLYWPRQECPHDHVLRRGHKVFLFNEDEVRRWLEGTGQAVKPGPRSIEAPAAAAAPLDIFSAKAEELRGELDYDGLVANARQELDRLLKAQPPEDAEPGWAVKWRKEFASAYETLVGFDEKRHAARVRRGELIARSIAERMVEGQAERFRTALEQLAADLGRAAAMDLAPIVPAEQYEQARRTVAATARRVVEDVLGRLAREIREAAA